MRAAIVVSAAGLTVLAGLAGSATADTYYVNAAGGADFEAIKPAVEFASEGDIIYVAAGTYDGPDNRDIEMPGTNMQLIAQGNVTIDCEGQGRAFSLSDGIDSSTLISGFHIMNGVARLGPSNGGGAIQCWNASPIIEYCTIHDCDGDFGGALKLMYCEAIVRYCVLRDNTADYGGAVSSTEGSPFLDRVHLWGNSASLSGGAIRTYNGSPRMNRLNVVRNSSPPGNAAIRIGGTGAENPEITNCIIALNSPGAAIAGGTTGTIQYCITYGNSGGDDLPSYAAPENLICDPLFCDVYTKIWEVCEESQAIHTVNPWGQYIGYIEVECYAPCQSPVEEASWGAIKALYR